MTSFLQFISESRRFLFTVASFAVLSTTTSGMVAEDVLVPQTKLRITVVQWMPMKGVYEQWSALGGDFVVSDDGTISVPVVGAIPVEGRDSKQLADEISNRLQQAMGTVDIPNTTVEIMEYPPIYVVGDVNTPGSHGYRPGMSVLKAIAMSGGQSRSQVQPSDEIKLVGDLRSIESDILRARARIARLEAEMDGATEIRFPQMPLDPQDQALAEEVQAHERMIMQTRANELERQTKSLNELRELLHAEIGVLEQKIVASDQAIAAAERELKGVTTLVEKGIAIASRQSDLERALTSHRADRLDQVTAIMRARQGVAEATRSLDGLHDRRKTEIASELQQQRASLEQMLLKRETSQKLLLELLAKKGPALDEPQVSMTIVRLENGQSVEIEAEESTPLMPGDVVKVKLNKPKLDSASLTHSVSQ